MDAVEGEIVLEDCPRHLVEATHRCARCRIRWCVRCVVRVRGGRRVLCIDCALHESGVRVRRRPVRVRRRIRFWSASAAALTDSV